jgi:hypothetical protein
VCFIIVVSNITPDLASYSWVDRDMFMCYLGGGIGHLWQGVPQRVTYDMDMDAEPEDDSISQAHIRDPFNVLALELLVMVESPDQAEGDESLSYSGSGLNSDSNSDLDSNTTQSDCHSDDEDLGPEDGENSDDNDNLYYSF